MTIDIGLITGVIGAVTGLAGLIMGFIAFRHSRQIISANRKLELEILRNEVHLNIVGLVELLPKALSSKKSNQAARNFSQSSLMDGFQEQYEIDRSRAHELAQQVPATENNFSSLSREELEAKLVELDRTNRWIAELVAKYEASMRDDREWSQQNAPRRQ